MNKYFLILISLIFFVQIVSQNADAYCTQRCLTKDSDSSCYATDDKGALDTAIKTWTCTLNEKPVTGILYLGYTIKSSCFDFSTYCYERACPPKGITSLDGQPCTVRVPCNVGCLPGSLTCCDTRAIRGVWDASEGKCVVCTPDTAAKKKSEFLIAGDQSNPYVYINANLDVPTYTLQNPDEDCLLGTPEAHQIGNAKFESACGADAVGDEKVEGDSCGTNKICNKLGNCIVQGCVPCDNGITPCDSCNSKGEFCKNVNNVGKLLPKDDAEAVAQCQNECVKYAVKSGINQKDNSKKENRNLAEICYDTPIIDGGIKKYTNWMVDEYVGTGSQIKETSCDNFKCKQNTVVCGAGESLMYDGLNSNLPKPKNPVTATKAFYCLDIGDFRGDWIPPTDDIEEPPGCSTCSNPAVCAGECVPGEPPYKYTAGCGKVAACGQCGCGPAQYQCTSVACNAGTGLCGYNSPPGLCGDVPDCTLTTPDFEYNKTIVTTSTYLLSGNNLGTFSGYKWDGAQWQANSINIGLAEASYSSPAVFFNGNSAYLVSGRGDGSFGGYSWDGARWIASASANSGLADIGSNSKPSIFYMDGTWNMIAGNNTGEFSGYTYSGAGYRMRQL